MEFKLYKSPNKETNSLFKFYPEWDTVKVLLDNDKYPKLYTLLQDVKKQTDFEYNYNNIGRIDKKLITPEIWLKSITVHLENFKYYDRPSTELIAEAFKINPNVFAYMTCDMKTQEMANIYFDHNPPSDYCSVIKNIGQKLQTKYMFDKCINFILENVETKKKIKSGNEMMDNEDLSLYFKDLEKKPSKHLLLFEYLSKKFQTQDVCDKLFDYDVGFFLDFRHDLQKQEACKIFLLENCVHIEDVNKDLITTELCFELIKENLHIFTYLPRDKQTRQICDYVTEKNFRFFRRIRSDLVTQEMVTRCFNGYLEFKKTLSKDEFFDDYEWFQNRKYFGLIFPEKFKTFEMCTRLIEFYELHFVNDRYTYDKFVKKMIAEIPPKYYYKLFSNDNFLIRTRGELLLHNDFPSDKGTNLKVQKVVENWFYEHLELKKTLPKEKFFDSMGWFDTSEFFFGFKCPEKFKTYEMCTCLIEFFEQNYESKDNYGLLYIFSEIPRKYYYRLFSTANFLITTRIGLLLYKDFQIDENTSVKALKIIFNGHEKYPHFSIGQYCEEVLYQSYSSILKIVKKLSKDMYFKLIIKDTNCSKNFKMFLFERMPIDYQNNRIVDFAIRQIDVSLFEHVRNDLKNHFLCMYAVSKDGKMLKYIDDPEDPTENLIIDAIQRTPHTINHKCIPPKYINKENVLKALVGLTNDDKLFEQKSFCDDKLFEQKSFCDDKSLARKTQEMCGLAVVQNHEAFIDVPDNLKTWEMCKNAIFKDYTLFKHVPTEMLTTEMCTHVINNEKQLFNKIPKSCQTLEMCIDAINYDFGNFNIVNEKFWDCLFFSDKIVIEIKMKIIDLLFKENARHYSGDVYLYLFAFLNIELQKENCSLAIRGYLDKIYKYVSKYDWSCNSIVKDHNVFTSYFRQQDITNYLIYKIRTDLYRIMDKKFQTQDVAWEMVRFDVELFKHVRSNLKTKEMCLHVVKTNGKLLRFVDQQTEEICIEAVKNTIEAIKYISLNNGEFQCSICLNADCDDDDGDDCDDDGDYVKNSTIEFKCCHVFHKKCILVWLKNNNTCPLCRCNI